MPRILNQKLYGVVHTTFAFTSYTQAWQYVHMGRVDLRASEFEIAAWKQMASEAGETLSEWIRMRLNGEVDEGYRVQAAEPATQVRGTERRESVPGGTGARMVEDAVEEAIKPRKRSCVHGRAVGEYCGFCFGPAIARR